MIIDDDTDPQGITSVRPRRAADTIEPEGHDTAEPQKRKKLLDRDDWKTMIILFGWIVLAGFIGAALGEIAIKWAWQ